MTDYLPCLDLRRDRGRSTSWHEVSERGNNRGGGISVEGPRVDPQSIRNPLWALVLVLIPEPSGRMTSASSLPPSQVPISSSTRGWTHSIAALWTDIIIHRTTKQDPPPNTHSLSSVGGQTLLVGAGACQGLNFCSITSTRYQSQAWGLSVPDRPPVRAEKMPALLFQSGRTSSSQAPSL